MEKVIGFFPSVDWKENVALVKEASCVSSSMIACNMDFNSSPSENLAKQNVLVGWLSQKELMTQLPSFLPALFDAFRNQSPDVHKYLISRKRLQEQCIFINLIKRKLTSIKQCKMFYEIELQYKKRLLLKKACDKE